MSKEFSQPAFPVPGLSHDEDFNGMNLRDYFAAQAVTGLMGRVWDSDNKTGNEIIEQWAVAAYAVADAMLAARAK